jgi:hypothetical protein
LILALKLVLTPLLIAGASLAGRRWGGAVSGSLVALPLTSGPIAAFLVAEHGAGFGARVAVGALSGVPAEIGFCLGFAAGARRGWPIALAVATAAFAGAGAAVEALPLAPHPAVVLPLMAAVLAAIAVGVLLLPRPGPAAREPAPPARWDLPTRAAVATALVVALTEAATAVGARLTGLLAVFPVYVTVLAMFALVHAGRDGALRVLRGVVVGVTSFAAFFLVVGLLLTHVGAVAAFVAAAAAALAVQAASLAVLRYRTTTGCRTTAPKR